MNRNCGPEDLVQIFVALKFSAPLDPPGTVHTLGSTEYRLYIFSAGAFIPYYIVHTDYKTLLAETYQITMKSFKMHGICNPLDKVVHIHGHARMQDLAFHPSTYIHSATLSGCQGNGDRCRMKCHVNCQTGGVCCLSSYTDMTEVQLILILP